MWCEHGRLDPTFPGIHAGDVFHKNGVGNPSTTVKCAAMLRIRQLHIVPPTAKAIHVHVYAHVPLLPFSHSSCNHVLHLGHREGQGCPGMPLLPCSHTGREWFEVVHIV